jgi:hypothetical protein
VAGQLGHGGLGQGADVTTITLSSNQHAACCRRADAAGVGDLVDVRLLDYRDVRGQYDAVVSVEMFEAVGREHWPAYFGALRRLTAPGGRIRLRAITMPHDRMLAAAGTQTWIPKYTFPGGLIPSQAAIRSESQAAGLHKFDELVRTPLRAHAALVVRAVHRTLGGTTELDYRWGRAARSGRGPHRRGRVGMDRSTVGQLARLTHTLLTQRSTRAAWAAASRRHMELVTLIGGQSACCVAPIDEAAKPVRMPQVPVSWPREAGRGRDRSSTRPQPYSSARPFRVLVKLTVRAVKVPRSFAEPRSSRCRRIP